MQCDKCNSENMKESWYEHPTNEDKQVLIWECKDCKNVMPREDPNRDKSNTCQFCKHNLVTRWPLEYSKGELVWNYCYTHKSYKQNSNYCDNFEERFDFYKDKSW